MSTEVSVVKEQIKKKWNESASTFDQRPEADIGLLEKLGLKARFKSFKDPRSHGFLNNIKYGYHDLFVVIAVKGQ